VHFADFKWRKAEEIRKAEEEKEKKRLEDEAAAENDG